MVTCFQACQKCMFIIFRAVKIYQNVLTRYLNWNIFKFFCEPLLEVCTCRIFQTRAWRGPHGCNPGPPETKSKISAQFRPRPEQFFFSNFSPDRLGFSDFKTYSFSELHKINVFFADDLFFCNLLKKTI